MKVHLERSALLEALSHQHSLIERRSTIPILTHVLLEAKGVSLAETSSSGASSLEGPLGSLALTGTDLELSLLENIPAQVVQEGRVTVSAHTLHDIVRKLSGKDPVAFSHDPASGTLEIRHGKAEFSLPTLPEETFPPIHPQTLPHSLTLPGTVLKNLLESTRFAISPEQAMQSFNAICFHAQEDQWRAVATDSHRLAMAWTTFPRETLEAFPTILVGRKAINEMNKLLDNRKDPVTFSFSDKQMMLRFQEICFSSRLVEGRFPSYEKAIPQNHPYAMVLDVKTFSQIIDRVGMVSAENQSMVILNFSPQELVISARSLQYGSGKESMAIDYDGPPCILGFNPRYLLDICHHIKGPTMELIMKDNLSPSILRDTHHEGSLYVLMPVRLP